MAENENFIGLDIGGANLKICTSHGSCRQIPFALWQRKNELSEMLYELLVELRSETACDSNQVVATMTGELADCFENREQGVGFIVDSLTQACQQLDCTPPLFYRLDRTFVKPELAKSEWRLVAAANWNAIANWIAMDLPRKISLDTQHCVLVDLGSTTCDIIPILNHRLLEPMADDYQRLVERRMVYAGIKRTPICSLLDELQLGDQSIPLAREFFATILDSCLILGLLPEDKLSTNTADGRPATKTDARRRLAKMICLDEDIDEQLLRSLATESLNRLRNLVVSAIECNIGHFDDGLTPELILSGEGAVFLETWLSERHASHLHRLDLVYAPEICSAMAAYAVARLASETLAKGRQ